MIDLSKHIQEGARLELEALEASADECSFLSAQNSAQAMRIDELQAEIGRLRLDAQSWWKKVSDLEAEIDNWKSWGVIEVAIRNPNVSSYMKHWEERAEKAERELAAANARVEALKADRDKLLVMASRMADCINRCQDEDDCSDLSAAYDFRQEYPR